MLASLAPTAVKVYPLAATGIEVRAVFHQANGVNASYARFEIATAADFTGTLAYDSGQVSITEIADGAEGVMVFPWIPTAADTYYYRLCFWDSVNHSQTTWLVWNGTTVSESDATVTVRPVSDSSIDLPAIVPSTPTTHYDKVNEASSDGDTTYVAQNTSGTNSDLYNAGSGSITSEKIIKSVKVLANVKANDGTPNHCYVTLKLNTGEGTEQSPGYGYALKSTVWTTNPDTGAAFTVAEANALKIGVKLRYASTAPLCTQVYAEITVGTYTFTFSDPGDNALDIGFPTNVSLSTVQDGQTLIATVTLDDTYSKPPNVTFMVDADMTQPDSMTVTGSYTYTFTGRLKVTTGWHRVSCLVGNVWTVVNVAQRLVYVAPVALAPDIRVIQNDVQLDAQHITVNEVCLPEYNTCTFDVARPIQGAFTVEVQAGGLKRFDMEVTRVDGLTVTGCSKLKRVLNEQVSLSYLSIGMLDLLRLMLSPWQVQGRTDLVTGTWDLLDTTTTKADVVSQIATRCGIALAEGKGVVNILPFRESELPEARLCVDTHDPLVSASVDYEGICNVVRQAYQLDRYPIPPNAATNHDAAQWTGTVSDATGNANSVVPPSGSAYCLKGNGLIKRTMSFLKGDYDFFHCNYAPAAVGQSVEVRLYSDATNYWKATRVYAGGAGAGFTVTGSSQTSSVTKSLSFTAARLAEVTIATTSPCIAHIELKSGATSLFVSGDMTVDSEGRTFLVPEAVYTASAADSMVLTFTNLYAVGSSWGVVCSSVTGKEYYSYLTGTPGADAIDWTDSRTYVVGTTGAMNYSTSQTITVPVHPSAPVRTVPPGCLVGGQRYYLHYIVYAYNPATHTTGAVLRTFDTGLASGDISHPSYGRAFIQDGQLYIDEYGGQLTFATGPDEAWVIQLCADITLYTTKTTVVTTTVWDFRGWSYGTSYPLWDDVTLKLADFTASGSPGNAIVAVGFNAATDFYIDELWLERSSPRWQWVEVQDDTSIGQYGRRVFEQKTGDVHSSASALALASGILEELKDPAEEYTATYPIPTWIELGESVDVGDVTRSIASLHYEAGTITASIGRTTGNLRNTIQSLARRQDALEREL